ncbi:sigma-70 family RNA polymerase sigma factor [Gimesia fumaroli]|jgi:RNA polymerase sigma-70 factor|uniref:RNA polymerase sigma factor n=1 Tax=Gimesia fumaroli TaxID=2527976 RepID=A0A518I6Y0_9PLAN|nr:sigma-70 family RNA polymerase sigma factor [Gimesia fumaroli]QDV48852.1 RNA polymerase sigma factor [Gimesia fumaroli]
MSNSIPSLDQSARSHFTSLLSKERLRIFGYIQALVPHSSDAEDVYQRVCLTLWNKFDEFDQERDFFFWACGIAFYTVCNHRRSIKHDRHCFNQELIETISQKREQHLSNYNVRIELLRECLNDLDSADQQLLQNATLKNQKIKEIAKTAQKSIQTLYNRLSILRRELADCVSRRLQSERQV